MTAIRKTLLILCTVLISLIVAGVVYLTTLDSSSINAYAITYVEQYTPYSLELDDTTSIKWRGNLTAEASGVKLTYRNTGKAFITAESATMSLNWKRLLSGKIDIQHLSIQKPAITLYKSSSKSSDTKKQNNNTTLKNSTKAPKPTLQNTSSIPHPKQEKPNKIALRKTQEVPPTPLDLHDDDSSQNTLMINHITIDHGTLIYKNKDNQLIYKISGISLNNNDLSLSPKALHSSLKDWIFTSTSHGNLTIDQSQWGPWALSDISVFYNINQGKITLSPILYKFNGVEGKASFILHYEEPQWIAQLKNHIEDAHIDSKTMQHAPDNSALQFATLPLIFDIEHGNLSVMTDIDASFDDFNDIGSHINGNINLKLTHGKIKRFNLGYELKRLEDRVNRIEDSDPPKTDGTEFNKFSINMTIKDGITQPFPVILDAKDFSFDGKAQINMVRDPAWMKMRVYIKPQPGRFPKLEKILHDYLGDSHKGAIPLEFNSPLYKPSHMVIIVDTTIVEKVLNEFFASWPKGAKDKLIKKLQKKLKKSLTKMQKRLNEGNDL